MDNKPPRMLTAEDVMERLSASKSTAYLIMRDINRELEERGLRIQPGRVSQEKNGTWTAQFRYEDIYGKEKHKCKRGFATREDAELFEAEFHRRTRGSLDMRFADFVGVYAEDMKPYLRENTWLTKEYMINDKIIPHFGKKRVRDITTRDIIDWQNELLESKKRNGQPYTETYLRTVSNQLAVILNHAEQHYGLSPNPMAKAPKIGAREAREVNVWTKEQYLRFSEQLANNPAMFTPIEVLYWTGIRVGELLALMPNDIDFNRCELYVRHSYQRLKGKDTITPPRRRRATARYRSRSSCATRFAITSTTSLMLSTTSEYSRTSRKTTSATRSTRERSSRGYRA